MKTNEKKIKTKVMFILSFFMSLFMSVTIFAASDATMIITNPGENASTEMRISWHTDVSVTGSFVEYTKKSDVTWANVKKVVGSSQLSTTWDGVTSIISSSAGNFVQDIKVNKCGAVLSNLDPDTDYMYRVGLNELSDVRYFKTAGASEYSFAWISDYHAYDPLPSRLTTAMNMIGKLVTASGSGGVNFILSTGDDVAYGGSYTYWQNVFAQENYKKYMWVTMIGNHDHMDRTDSKNTDAYYRDTHNNPPNGYPGQEGCSYWFKYGDVLWIILNTEDLNTSTQVPKAQAWLEQVIASNPSKYIFVAEHYQWFNGINGASNTGFTRWYSLFDKCGVTLAMSGNNHVYVRTKSLSDNQVSSDPSKGTVYIQAPSSDNDRGQAMDATPSSNADKIAYRWTEGPSTVGGMLVTVGEEKIKIRLYDRNGTLLDDANIPEEPPVPVPPVITDVSPENLSAVNIKNPIELTFSWDMDKASVEEATSFLPVANVSYTWTNDNTVRINISQLDYETSYTLTMNGSIAKSTEGKFLDGNNDGTEYSDYVLNFTTASAMDDMEGDYYVPINPGGGEKWFPTLKDACDAINTNAITGDVRLWVNGDIASPNNVGLINNTDYSITIKSYGNVKRSITFSSNVDPGGPSASFLIGSGSGLTWADISPAKNITLDSLVILTSSTSGGNFPIVIVDACKDITIKNCSIRHMASGSYAVYLRGVINRTEANIQKKMPENVTIEDSEITHLASGSGQAIGITADASPTAANRAKGLVIKDNIITARTRGVFLNHVDGMTFTGNEIHVSQNGTYNSMGMYASGAYGIMTIAGNKFIELTTVVTTASSTTDYGIKGIYVSGSGANWHIDNNYFAGFNKTSGSGSASLHAIHFTGSNASATNTFIRHNTFYMGELSNIPTGNTATPAADNTDPAYATIFLTSGTATIKNNLFVGSEDRFPNFFFKGEASIIAADNNVFCTPTTTTNFKIASSGIIPSDLKMVENVVFTDAATGNLDILSNSSSEKDENLAVPLLAEVTTDIYGTKRGTKTYVGAHEADPFVHVNITDNMANSIRVVYTGSQIVITSDDPIQSVEIYDLQGRAIDSKQNILNCIYSITVHTTGIYIVKTITEGGYNVQKVVVK